ncbi:MAG: hypothetical protein HC915_05550 [Anaerolineae bacterium]|nr:hypothetical protein [Anaerolineae bacterium]
MSSEVLFAEQFFPRYEGERWELLHGQAVPRPAVADRAHGIALNLVAFHLGQHVLAYNLGFMFSGGSKFLLRRTPDLVRDPDLAFVRMRAWPPTKASATATFHLIWRLRWSLLKKAPKT